MLPNIKSAVSFINNHGLLLAYPIKNKVTVPSLWSCFYPKKEMRWEWTDDGDDRVALIWHLRAKLSTCRKVVYTKWFGGRATFFSFQLFTALLNHVSKLESTQLKLSHEALSIMQVLNDDSPLPTKVLRIESGLEGKHNEGIFNKALRELWSRLLIVGYGEVEEGGFPSLAVGLTKLLFEDLWDESIQIDSYKRDKIIGKFIPEESAYYRKLKTFIKMASS